MKSHSYPRRAKWHNLCLLLLLFTALLPASTASSAPLEMSCGTGIQSRARSLGYPVSSDEEVTIPKETVDAAIFAAIFLESASETESVATSSEPPKAFEPPQSYKDDMYLLRHVVEMLFVRATESGELWPYLREAREKVESALSGKELPYVNEYLHTMLDVALTIPQLQPYVDEVWEGLVNREFGWAGRQLTEGYIAYSARKYSIAERTKALWPDLVKSIHDCAQKNPKLAENFDKLNGTELKISIKDDAKTMLAKRPKSRVPAKVKEQIQPDGTLRLSLDELKKMSQEEFGKINAGIHQVQKQLVEIDKKQQVLIDYAKREEERALEQAKAAAAAADHKLKIDAAKSSVMILSTLTGFIDEERGQQLSVVGNAAIEIYESVNTWMKAVAGLGKLEALTSLSTVVMTGNVLGAVMNVISLFGNSGPSPEQMILEEIGKLRQQVNELRTEMHDRFDRIDKELNSIYTTMQDRFNLIDIQLGKIDGNVLEIQTALAQVDTKLSRMERNNFELINAVSRRELVEAVNLGLGYQQRTGLPMPFSPNFDSFANKLYTWVTYNAYDAGSVGPSQRDYSDAAVFTELNAYPIDANLNYLNGWLITHGLPAISNKQLPNPRDWLFAARAYTQLGVEWPQHMEVLTENDPRRVNQMQRVALDVESAVRNISTLTTVSGTMGNTLLFSNVITYYQAKLDALDLALQSKEAAYVYGLWAHPPLNRTTPFNLYGGIDQNIVYAAPEVETFTCGNAEAHGSYVATSNLKSLIPNYNRYNLADYLGLGKLTTCLKSEYLDLAYQCDTDYETGETKCYYLGRHKPSLTVYYNNVPIMSQSLIEEQAYVPDYGIDEVKWFWKWHSNGGYKLRFEGLSIIDTPSPELAAQQAATLADVTATLNSWFENKQQTFYRQMEHELSSAGLRNMAAEVAGGKALLSSFTSLGLSRAVDQDELLRAMLYGNQQLVDDQQIIQTYALSGTRPITGTALLMNPRVPLMNAADQRTAALSGLLGGYLNAITAGTHRESIDYIANARRELDLTVRISQLDAPQLPNPDPNPDPDPNPNPIPNEPKRVFLPLVSR